MSAANAARCALPVTDVQQPCLHGPYRDDADLPAFRDALLRLEAGRRAGAALATLD